MTCHTYGGGHSRNCKGTGLWIWLREGERGRGEKVSLLETGEHIKVDTCTMEWCDRASETSLKNSHLYSAPWHHGNGGRGGMEREGGGIGREGGRDKGREGQREGGRKGGEEGRGGRDGGREVTYTTGTNIAEVLHDMNSSPLMH